MPTDRTTAAFTAVTSRLFTVCTDVMHRVNEDPSTEQSLLGIAGRDFNFRESCGIEELPALMLYERLPLEMVLVMLEGSIKDIDLAKFDILWSEEPFTATWGEGSEYFTPPAREALEKYLRTFRLPGTWECQLEEDPNIAIWHGKCMFFVNRAEILEWDEDGRLLHPRTKS